MKVLRFPNGRCMHNWVFRVPASKCPFMTFHRMAMARQNSQFSGSTPENPFAHWMSFAPLINHIHTLVSEIPSRENGKTSRSHSWILWPLYGLKPRTRSGFIANTLSRLWRTHYNYLEHVNKAEISQGEWRTGNQHKNKPEARCINHPPNWPPTYPPTHASLHHSVEH